MPATLSARRTSAGAADLYDEKVGTADKGRHMGRPFLFVRVPAAEKDGSRGRSDTRMRTRFGGVGLGTAPERALGQKLAAGVPIRASNSPPMEERASRERFGALFSGKGSQRCVPPDEDE
jgi:hypothetical protein